MAKVETAAEILKVEFPEHLFTSYLALEREYKELAKRWHPDLLIGDAQVMAHINSLYQKAQAYDLITWPTPGTVLLPQTMTRFHFQHKQELEFGSVYYSKKTICFTFLEQMSSLLRIPAPDLPPEVKKEFEVKVPHNIRFMKPLTVAMSKHPKEYLLRHVLDVLPTHAACWVMSDLHNFMCYLEHTGQTHNAINVDSIWINPDRHSIHLYGGWWYARPVGERLPTVPLATYPFVARDILKEKVATHRIDAALVKALGRRLFAKEPGPVYEFFQRPPLPTAVENYRAYGAAMVKQFGPRRFTKWEITL